MSLQYDDVLLKLFLTNLIGDQQDLDTYCCHVLSPYVGPDKKIIKSSGKVMHITIIGIHISSATLRPSKGLFTIDDIYMFFNGTLLTFKVLNWGGEGGLKIGILCMIM